MNNLDLGLVYQYVEHYIWPEFHQKKLEKIESLQLNDILKRKNPYLFKAKNTLSASDFIGSILDASLSSGEETTFGNFIESLAIYVCGLVYSGRKSSTKGLDLEFENNNDKYLVSIKSGPNWGNASQIAQMRSNFNTAKRILQTSGGNYSTNFICIEGCCYGYDNNPHKGTHIKLCGQDFWCLISGGNDNLYRDIIEPIGHRAKEMNDIIIASVTSKKNLLTAEFIYKYCDSTGAVDWLRLIDFVSARRSSNFNQI